MSAKTNDSAVVTTESCCLDHEHWHEGFDAQRIQIAELHTKLLELAPEKARAQAIAAELEQLRTAARDLLSWTSGMGGRVKYARRRVEELLPKVDA